MAPTIRLFVPKFGREVVIESDHPLALAALASAAPSLESAVTTDTPSASVPAVSVTPDSPAVAVSRKKKGRS